MNDYLQPSFYRFNSDSLELINFLRTLPLKPKNILDLGAGCGIIGIELALHFLPNQLTLLEAQSDFAHCLESNIKNFLPKSTASQIIYTTFGEYKNSRKYDLLVCNPPYYLPGRGQKAADLKRNICRAFDIDNWEILISCISESMNEKGCAFIVLKEDLEHLSIIRSFLPKACYKEHHRPGVVIYELFGLHKN